jgi:hypothetical protein
MIDFLVMQLDYPSMKVSNRKVEYSHSKITHLDGLVDKVHLGCVLAICYLPKPNFEDSVVFPYLEVGIDPVNLF